MAIALIKGDGPAVDRDHVQRHAQPDLVKKFDKAGIALSKAGLSGIRAQAMMILDHSGSMDADYKYGTVQTLVDRALGFALQIDVDGLIPIIPFDSKVWPIVDVYLSNYVGVVNRYIYRPDQMGGTRLNKALQMVLDVAAETDAPIYLMIVTDDSPSDATAVRRTLDKLKAYPVFIKVLTLLQSDFWDNLDNQTADIDNIDTQYISEPSALTDLEFSSLMVEEWSEWLDAAAEAGIVL